MRQVVLDTETTGLAADRGHRVIEIGCVELRERRRTGITFHRYLNPDRAIDAGALEVHGISEEFLRDKPRFREVVDEFVDFVSGSELVIHNAAFDLAFLDAELALAGGRGRMTDHAGVLDTLALARERYPGQRNSLDALCRRLGIDNQHREMHGALLDASLLADVYLAMTAGQGSLELVAEAPAGGAPEVVARDRPAARVRVLRAGAGDLLLHEARMDTIAKACRGVPVWRRGT
ncbi:MAG: DNA polymerase III subunit epsilon [Pseudomonadota bacterium]|jgi:DNA polymerase-3 subunit epsilon